MAAARIAFLALLVSAAISPELLSAQPSALRIVFDDGPVPPAGKALQAHVVPADSLNGSNVIDNPSFEAGTTAWTAGGEVGSAGSVSAAANGTDGEQSIRLNVTNSAAFGSFFVSQSFPIRQGGRYSLRYDVLGGPGQPKLQILVRETGADGKPVDTYFERVPAQGWESHHWSWTPKVPASTGARLFLRYLAEAGRSYSVGFDNVAIVALPELAWSVTDGHVVSTQGADAVVVLSFPGAHDVTVTGTSGSGQPVKVTLSLRAEPRAPVARLSTEPTQAVASQALLLRADGTGIATHDGLLGPMEPGTPTRWLFSAAETSPASAGFAPALLPVGPGLRIDVNRTAKFGSAFVHQSLPVFDDAPFALHVLARDQGNLSAYEFLFREVNRTGAKADTTFRFQPTSGHWLPLSMAWSPKLAEARTVDVHMRFLIQADRTEHVEFAQPVLWSTLAFAWTIDEAPEVKTNGPFLPASLEPGEHRIGLTVEGAFGTKGQATLDLDVGLPDIRPRLEQLALATLHRPAAFSLDPVLADGRSPIRNPAFHEGKAGWRTGSPLDNWQVEQQDGRPAARLMAADGIPLSISQTVPNPCVAALCVLDVEHRGDSEATARVRAFGSGPSGELLLEETTFGLPSDTGWNRSRLAFEVRSPLADRLVVEVGFLSPGVGNRSLDLRQIVVQRAFADVWEVHGASAAQAGSGLQLPLTFTAPGQHELAVAVTMDRETGPLLGHGQTEITVLPVVLFSRPGQCFGLQVAAAPDMSGEVVATADGHVVATVGIGNGTQRLVDPLSARAEGNVLEVIGDCAGVSLAYLDDGGTSLPLQPPRTWPPPSDQVLAEPDLRPSWHVVRATLDVHALVLDPGLREGTLIVRRDGHTLGKATFVVGQDGTLDASVPLAPLAASGPYDLRMEVADTGLGRYDIDMGRHDLDLPNDPSAVALVAALVMVGLLAAMAPFVRRRQ